MPRKLAVFTIRYSLFSRDIASRWRVGRGDEKTYLAKLFDPDRLRFRRFSFANVTVPSLAATIAQCPDLEAEVHVLASTLLPREDQNFLEDLAKRNPFLRVFFQPPEDISLERDAIRFCEAVPSEDLVASIRIDDDDALTEDYLRQLSEHMIPEKVGHVVSLGSGYYAFADDDDSLTGPFLYRWQFATAGLALIRRGGTSTGRSTIYKVGNHMNVDAHFPTIIDARKPAFLRLFHHSCDTWTDKRASYEMNDFAPEGKKKLGVSSHLWRDPEPPKNANPNKNVADPDQLS